MQHKYGSLLKRIVLPSPLSSPCDSPSFVQPPDLGTRAELSCWKKPHAACFCPQKGGDRFKGDKCKWTFSCALVGQGVYEGISVKNVLTHKSLTLLGEQV